MNTDRIEEFVVLSDLLNFSRAADALFISQSILSRHIKELEHTSGHTLFKRNTHGVELTEEGKYFLKWAEPFLKEQDRVLSVMAEEPIPGISEIRILCSEQIITTDVLSFIHEFEHSYPDIHLDVVPIISAETKDILYSCDVMLSSNEFVNISSKGIERSLLTNQRSLLAVPPQHSLGDLQEISLSDLSGQSLIVPFMDDAYSSYARNSLTANRKCHGMVKRIAAENPQAGLLKVELGAGVMLIPHHLVKRVYPHTRTISVTDNDCIFPIYAYRNKTSENKAADLFYEKICSRFTDR